MRRALVIAVLAACGGTRDLSTMPVRPQPSGVAFVAQVIPGSTTWVRAALTPDGKLALLGDAEGGITAVDTERGKLLRSLRPHSQGVVALAVVRDGVAMSAASDGSVCELDVVELRIVRCRRGESVAFHAAAFSPDGAIVAGGSKGFRGTSTTHVALWSTGDGQKVVEREAHQGAVEAIAWSPDGKRFATVGHDASSGRLEDAAALWDSTGKRLASLGAAKAIAFLPDGRLLHGGAAGIAIHPAGELGAGGEQIVAVGASAVALRTGDRKAKLVELGGAVHELDAEAVDVIAATPRLVLAASAAQGTIALFDSGGRALRRFAIPRAGITAGTITDDRRVLLGTRGGLVTFDLANGAIRTLAVDATPRLIATSGRFAVGEVGAATRLLGLTGDRVTSVRDLPRSPDGAYAFACRPGPGCRLYAGGRLADAARDRDPVTLPAGAHVALSADGRRFARLVGANDRGKVLGTPVEKDFTAEVVDATTGARLGSVITNNEVDRIALSDDGALVAFVDGKYDDKADYGTRVRVFEVATGRAVFELEADKDGVGAIAFSRDGTRLAIGGANHRASWRTRGTAGNDVIVVDARTGKTLRRYQGHRDAIGTVAFAPDGRHLLSVSRDGTARLWRIDDGYAITIVAVGSEWLIHDDAGMFDASRSGESLVAVAKGPVAYAIDQLAPRNNRPDVLLARAGIGDPATIEHFRYRYQLRLDKLGLREADLSGTFESAPVAQIVDVRRDGTHAVVVAELTSPAADLTGYRIWANGVPVGAAKRASGRRARIEERIELAAGPNRIEVGASAQNGVESLRAFRDVDGERTVAPTLYVLAFGVSKYRDASLDLQFAHKDAQDLAGVLAARRGTAFGEVVTKVLVDADVTAANIRAAKSFVQRARIDDTVVVFLAGHGTYSDDRAGEYLFVTHDADLDRLRETAAPFELVEDLLTDIPARRRLLLLDTCESGDRDEARAATPTAELASRGVRPRAARALVRVKSAPAPRVFLRDRERFIYNDLARRSGTVVFSSSHGSELSYESAEWQNGAFTAELKRALTSDVADTNGDGMLSTEELRRYVTAAVAARTGDLQHPTIDRDNAAGRVGLPAGRR